MIGVNIPDEGGSSYLLSFHEGFIG